MGASAHLRAPLRDVAELRDAMHQLRAEPREASCCDLERHADGLELHALVPPVGGFVPLRRAEPHANRLVEHAEQTAAGVELEPPAHELR